MVATTFTEVHGTDDQVVHSFSEEGFSQVSKSTIFYVGLVVFAIINFLLMWGIKAFREVKGLYPQSKLFKSDHQKARIQFWLTLLLASANFMLGFIIAYIGFIKIEGDSAQQGYIHLPIIGISLLAVTIVGLIAAIFSRN